MRKKLDEVYRGTGSSVGNSRTDKGDKDSRISFMVGDFFYLSFPRNSHIYADHLERPWHLNVAFGPARSGSFAGIGRQPALRGAGTSSCQKQFVDILSRERENNIYAAGGIFVTYLERPNLCSHDQVGLEQLFNQLIRPKLRTFIGDVHKDISYWLDEDSYAAADYSDMVRKRFIKGWDNLFDGYKVRSPAFRNLFAHGLAYSGCINGQQLPYAICIGFGCTYSSMGEAYHGSQILWGEQCASLTFTRSDFFF